jgi:hypothetical protein
MSNEDSPGQETPGNDRGTVTVQVEISEALVELIDAVNSEGDPLEDWVAGAAEMEARRRLWNDKTELPIPVPDEVQDVAELLQEHWRVQYGHELTYGDALTEVVNVRYEPPNEA